MTSVTRAWLAGLFCVACGGGASTAAAPSASEGASTSEGASAQTGETTGAGTSAGEGASAGTAAYELHEWGVVDVAEGGAIEIAAGAGLPQRPMSVRKPVVYVHLLDGTPELTFGLRVTLAAGTFVEHWPATTVTGTTLAWPSVVAHAAHCGDAGAREASRRSPVPAGCVAPDGVCEVAELDRYDAASAACLEVAGTTAGLLFYRGSAPTLALPIRASRGADANVVASADASLEGAPGGLIRLSTALSGPWPPGRVVISRAAFPATGGSVTLPVGTEVVTREQGIAELRASLLALGLDDAEASAFMAGWATELFGPQGGARDAPARYAGSGGPRHQDVLLYFLPAAAVESVSTLTATPPPRTIRRAFLVRIDLGAVATG